MNTVIPALLLAIIFGFLAITQTSMPLISRLSPRIYLEKKASYKSKYDSVQVLLEVPDFTSILWFAVSAGETLETSLRLAVSKSSGFVSTEFKQVLIKVDHGAILQHELESLAAVSRDPLVRELSTKLAVALATGGAVADQLGEFLTSATTSLRSTMLELAGKSETKMMIPMVFVILPVTVMFALYPSVAILQNSFL
ncbi:MAG: hypothetical protein RIQ88_817 [Actinomycetota bacterium]|jgi:tight adherence protein C